MKGYTMRTKFRKSIGILLSLLMLLPAFGAAVPASAADAAAKAEFEALRSQTIASLYAQIAEDDEPLAIISFCDAILMISETAYDESVPIEAYRSQLDAYVQMYAQIGNIYRFEAYRAERCMDLYALFAGTEREEEITAGSAGITLVDGVEYDDALTLAENKANVDAAVSAALASPSLPTPEGEMNEEFEALKSLFVGHFFNKIAEDDVPAAILTLCNGITGLLSMPYDEELSMEENEDALDDYADDIVEAAEECRYRAYAADRCMELYTVFADYEDEAVVVAGSEGVTRVYSTEYDKNLTLSENKANVDAEVAAALDKLAQLGVPLQDPDEPDTPDTPDNPDTPDAPDKPQNDNLCRWCGEQHTGFWGRIVGFFHSILWFFSRLFG